MVVFNFRLKSKAAAAAAAAFVAVLTAVICAFCAANVQTTVEAAPTINDGNFAEERAVGEYLDSLGYTDRALVSCDSVKIPREFDGVYGDYNALQEKNGFDLSKYKGKTVRRYTYSLGGTNSEFAVVLEHSVDTEPHRKIAARRFQVYIRCSLFKRFVDESVN